MLQKRDLLAGPNLTLLFSVPTKQGLGYVSRASIVRNIPDQTIEQLQKNQ